MGVIKQEVSWNEEVNFSSFSPLSKDLDVDVLVVGAGLTGLTTAYLLSKESYKVALIEKNKIGRGATNMTTAFLTQYLDTEIYELIALFGKDQTKLILDSHASAIDTVEKIIKEENIDCEFTRCSNYIYANSEKDMKSLQKEYEAAREIGLNIKLFEENNKLSFRQNGYLELPNQGKFHPLKYMSALTEILKKRGVDIYEETEAQDISEGELSVVKTNHKEIRAKNVVVATYAPFNNEIYFKKAFYTSYVLEISIPSGVIEEGIYEDTYNPYHYFRVDKMDGKDRIILGGADHRSDIPMNEDKNFKDLEEYASKIFSGISYNITKKWNGPIIEPVDGLAYIGAVKDDKVFYATGFSGNGMTYATIAAITIRDHICGNHNEWSKVYDAKRKPSLKQLAYKGRDYTEELIGGAVKNTFKHKS